MKLSFLGKRVIKKGIEEVLKNIYISTFWLRRKDILQLEEMIHSNDFYFTIELEKAGFTDQLIQFIIFYNLGTSLNLKYVHTRLNSSRSSVKTNATESNERSESGFGDVYDYLGLNHFLSSVSPKESDSDYPKTVILNIEDDSFYFNRGIAKKEHLIPYLKYRLVNEVTDEDHKVLIKFRLKGYSSFFKMYNSSEDYWRFPYDVRKIYDTKRGKLQQNPQDTEKGCSPLVHIRQGDTAAIKTPWKSYVIVWDSKKNAFKEFPTNMEALKNGIIPADHYYSFIKNLSQDLGPHFIGIQLYSDGFKRAFQALYQHKEKIGWSDEQLEQLEKHERTYDEKSFKKFSQLGNVKLCIGEDDSKLFELIDSVLQARVIIIGTQQQMIPKLLSVYCNPTNMPLVIVLTNKERSFPKSYGRKSLQPFYRIVNLKHYDSARIAQKIRAFLQK